MDCFSALLNVIISVPIIKNVLWPSLERATDGSLQSEDWTLNMEICDIINDTEDGWEIKDVWCMKTK